MSASPPAIEKSTAAQLIDALMAGGEAIDEGSFSLDTAAAAAKLDAYQYADRSSYLIAIAEAARGLDAGRVSVTTRGEDLSISIEVVNLPDPAKFLADPFAQLRGAAADRTSRALGRLGVGLHMALGHASIERIAVSYSSKTELLVAEYRRDAPARLARRDPDVIGELCILIDRPWSDRISLRGAGHAELEHLRKAVKHSPHRFELDDHLISQQAREWDYASQEHGAGFRYEGGFEAVGEDSSVIELWSEDVCVETLPGPGLAFRAAVHLDAPRRDLSQMKIVHDDAVQAALATVEAGYRSARTVLARDDANWPELLRPDHWPKARVDRVLERSVRGREIDPVRTIGHAIRATLSLAFGMFFYALGTFFGFLGFGMLFQQVLAGPWGMIPVALGIGAAANIGSGQIAAVVTDDKKKRLIVKRLLWALACLVAMLAALRVSFG